MGKQKGITLFALEWSSSPQNDEQNHLWKKQLKAIQSSSVLVVQMLKGFGAKSIK